MKIYFAGSVRGGREDVERYNKIIVFLKTYGEVLTEHIGDNNLSSKGQAQFSDKYIHDRDLKWLRNSDVLIAEVTLPSLGVGYEIGIATSEKTPIIALFKNNTKKRLSAMISGSESIRVIEYSEVEELFSKLDDMLNKIEFQL